MAFDSAGAGFARGFRGGAAIGLQKRALDLQSKQFDQSKAEQFAKRFQKIFENAQKDVQGMTKLAVEAAKLGRDPEPFLAAAEGEVNALGASYASLLASSQATGVDVSGVMPPSAVVEQLLAPIAALRKGAGTLGPETPKEKAQREAELTTERAKAGLQPEVASAEAKRLIDRERLKARFGADSSQVKEFDKIIEGLDEGGPLVTLQGPKNELRSFRRDDPKVDDLLKQGWQVARSGIEFEMTKDGTMRLRTGVGDFTTGATTAFQKDAQELENIIVQMQRLAGRLRPEDVGFRGVFGEFFVDRFLGQLSEAFVNDNRVANRNALRSVRERGLRLASVENRFSNQDRNAITRMFPEDGFFESVGAAKGKLLMLSEIFADRLAFRAQSLGRKPITEMTPEEIQSAVSAGTLSHEIATLTLIHLHGFSP